MNEIMINGLKIQYIDQGEGDVVLLLHGWNAPAETYRLIIDHLSTRYRVIAPNAPGCGGSDEPPVPWTVDDFVDFTVAFAQALGVSKAILMGHSFGGRTIIKLMNRQPCPLEVEKIVLMSAAGIRPKRSTSFRIKRGILKAMKPIEKVFPKLASAARNHMGSADYRAASEIMKKTMAICIEEDLTDLLPGVKAETLLIWGRYDTATPLQDGQTMEQNIPGAGLVILEGDHFAFAQQWPQCARVLDVFM